MRNRANVFCTAASLTETRFGEILSAAWGRITAKVGRGTFADGLGVTPETLGNATSGRNLPKVHTVFNSLLVDPTALDEIVNHYGFCLTPIASQAANDIATAAGTMDAMAALIRSLDDNHRDHNETLMIATLLRPHIGALNGIIEQADRLRGAA